MTDPLFYADCPRCGNRIGPPFNRFGGPQYAEHRCGEQYRPRRARFLIAASGESYMAYPFDAGEAIEPVFRRWVRYWSLRLVRTLPVKEVA